MSDRKEVKITQAGLQPDTTYIARVRTFDKLGNPSGWADAAQFTTPPLEGAYTPEHADDHEIPENFSIEAGYKSFLAQWDPDPQEDMKYGFGKYVLEVTWIDDSDDEHVDEVQLDSTQYFEEAGQYKYLYSNDAIKPNSDVSARVKARDPYDNYSSYTSLDTETTDLIYTEDLIDPLLVRHGQAWQSANWPSGTIVDDMTSSTPGWRMEADGKLGAGEVHIRGALEVDTFSTTGDETRGIYIESDLGADDDELVNPNNMISFRHSQLDPPWHANLRSFYIATGPDTGQHGLVLETHTDDPLGEDAPKLILSNDAGTGRVFVEGDEVYIGGIGTVKRPFRQVWRNGVPISISDATITVVPLTFNVHHNLLGPDGTDPEAVNVAGSGEITPQLEGFWRVELDSIFHFPASTEYSYQVGYRMNGTDDYWMDIRTVNALAHIDQAPANFSKMIYFDGSSDYIEVIAYQTRGASVNFDIRSLSLIYETRV